MSLSDLNLKNSYNSTCIFLNNNKNQQNIMVLKCFQLFLYYTYTVKLIKNLVSRKNAALFTKNKTL